MKVAFRGIDALVAHGDMLHSYGHLVALEARAA
jgi:hypothetical protein